MYAREHWCVISDSAFQLCKFTQYHVMTEWSEVAFSGIWCTRSQMKSCHSDENCHSDERSDCLVSQLEQSMMSIPKYSHRRQRQSIHARVTIWRVYDISALIKCGKTMLARRCCKAECIFAPCLEGPFTKICGRDADTQSSLRVTWLTPAHISVGLLWLDRIPISKIRSVVTQDCGYSLSFIDHSLIEFTLKYKSTHAPWLPLATVW